MSTVTVDFVGICTHFEKRYHPELPPRHRVLLVRSDGTIVIHGVRVRKHVARLQLHGRKRFDLHGVALTLALVSPHAKRPEFDIDPSFEIVPQLTALVAPLSALSPPRRTALGRSWSGASCYFEIDFGTLRAGTTAEGAVCTRLVASSADSDIVLKATPFRGAALPRGLAARTKLRDGARITVSNEDVRMPRKVGADFLLHYRTAARMPPIPQIPQILGPIITPEFPYGTIGAGCSNSSYP